MIESIIAALIYIVLLAIVVYLVIWVLQTIAGVSIPPKIVQLIWVVFVLVVLLILFRALAPTFRLSMAGGLLPLLV